MDESTQTGTEPEEGLDQAAQKVESLLTPKEDSNEPQEQGSEEGQEAKQDVKEGKATDQEADDKAKQETSFQHLQEIAEALEMPLDQFMGNIKGRVKINGEEKDVTLAELQKGYQMEADYRHKTSELSEQRKALDAERERMAGEFKSRLSEASQLTQVLEGQLLQEYNSVNWTELRDTNPAEFAARKQEYNERYAQIQNAKHQMSLESQRLDQERETKLQADLTKLRQDEMEKLVVKIPEFADSTKAEPLKQEIRKYLYSYDFTDGDIDQIIDHRHLLIVRDAMKYRELQNKKPMVENKVKEAPKLVKPGVKSNDSPESAKQNELHARLKKSGSLRDAAALVEKLL